MWACAAGDAVVYDEDPCLLMEDFVIKSAEAACPPVCMELLVDEENCPVVVRYIPISSLDKPRMIPF